MKDVYKVPCALYVRVSTEHEEQIRSAGNQREDIQKWVEDSRRFELVKIYEDRGITGTKADRPALQQMMEDAKKGKFHYIITKSISRFARDVVISVEYTRQLKTLTPPVGIYFIEEGLDTLQPGVDFTLGILSLVAQQESENISQHIMATFDAKMKAGIKVNGSVPFGYECITDKDGNRTLKIIEKEAKIIRQIFRWYLEGKSTIQISQDLRKRFGISKRATTIAKILHLETYVGDLKQKKQKTMGVRGKRVMSEQEETTTVHNHHTAIISREDFDEVQRLMAESGRGRHSRNRHPLSGLITCGRCGCKYQRHQVRDGMAWVCGSYQQRYAGEKTDCPGQKFKTTHEKTIMDLYKQAVYFLGYDMRNTKTAHFTKEQDELIDKLTKEVEERGEESTIRQWVQSITIGTEKIDRIIRFSFIFGVDVIFETDAQDTRYRKADCTLEVRV